MVSKELQLVFRFVDFHILLVLITTVHFLIYVLVCTAQTTKSMKTNDIPMKSPIEFQQEMQKKNLNFPKFVRFLGHFLKKQCFWKMGVAGNKQLPHPNHQTIQTDYIDVKL